MANKGAPAKNQNARTHGFYSQSLTEAEKIELESASGVQGLDDEIAVMRLKLRELIRKCPDSYELQFNVANILARMVKTRYGITNEQKKTLRDAIATVLRDIAVPLGINFIPH